MSNTTELAQAGCPFVVGYVATPLSYLAAKLILKTRWLTLLNIAAGREVAPEFIQNRCDADHLTAVLRPWLDDEAARAAQIADQNEALELMRGPQASGRAPAEIAADVIVHLVEGVDLRRRSVSSLSTEIGA